MNDSFTKLASSIVTSTVWGEPHATRSVWTTMLALADAQGVVSSTIPGLARMANATLAEVEAALATFRAPDPYSRTPDNEGRRIEDVPGGWRLLNHALYRAKRSDEDRRAYQTRWMAEKRARDRAAGVDNCGQLSTKVDEVEPGRPPSTQAEADTEAEAKKDQEPGARSARAARQPAKVSRGTAARGTRLTAAWQPDDEDKAYAASVQVDWKIEAVNFRDYWIARAGAGGVKLDWKATWRTWCRRADKTLSAPSKQPVGAKAALAKTESPLQHALAYAKQQFERGEFGEGDHGKSQYAAAIKTIKLRHGVKP